MLAIKQTKPAYHAWSLNIFHSSPRISDIYKLNIVKLLPALGISMERMRPWGLATTIVKLYDDTVTVNNFCNEKVNFMYIESFSVLHYTVPQVAILANCVCGFNCCYTPSHYKDSYSG